MVNPGNFASACILSLVLVCAAVPAPARAAAFDVVVIDAGHGGSDRGGIPGQKHAEKTYTLDTALRLEKALAKHRIKTVLTRTTDTYVSLDRRVDIANKHRKAIFVSIHFDAYWKSKPNGVTTFYCSGTRSRALANAVHKRLVPKLRPQNNRGVKTARFYVIRATTMPAILVEGGFLTCPWEADRILTQDYRQRIADAIADAIVAARDGKEGFGGSQSNDDE